MIGSRSSRRKTGASRNYTNEFQKYRNDKGTRINQYINYNH